MKSAMRVEASGPGLGQEDSLTIELDFIKVQVKISEVF